MPPPTYFPLRWESTGDQWWFVSPIDWAAANGHYDLVRELLHIDTNLLIKLTSLPRIRRLETVWDDDEEKFGGVAKCRSQVAQKLLLECENNKGQNSLIRAGYGGWLLYTAASAGDVAFVKELLERDHRLVFGEGEYGVTDMFYAAARSKDSHVFKLLFDCSISASPGNLKEEMMNRAVHAAARGGNMELLMELLGGGGDVLAYRDARGSTVLHTASGRGQVEVVKHLVSSYNTMIDSVDNRGNTALNVAAYRGHLAVVELLISTRPCLASQTNNYGDTFLHMAVSGFVSPGFRRLDRQLELMRQLVSGKLVDMGDIVNARNNEGRTALHIAVIENLQSQVVELLMSVPYINLNICDADGNTPLNLLKQRPHSASSEILIKRLIAAGGIDNCEDQTTRKALVSHLRRRHSIGGSSPGTSFRIPDAEIFLHTGLEDGAIRSSSDLTSSEYGYSGEIRSATSKYSKFASINSAARRFKNILGSSGKKARNADASDFSPVSPSSSRNSPLSLRQQFSKRGGSLPSPSSKKKFAAGLAQGVLQVAPNPYIGSPSSGFSESPWSSPISSAGKGKRSMVYHGSGSAGPSSAPHSPNLDNLKMKHKHASFNLRLMNNYFCFGAQGLAVDNSINSPRTRQNQHRLAV